MNGRKKAIRFGAAGLGSLVAGMAVGGFIPGLAPLFVVAGFVGYLYCGGRALALWTVRIKVEDHHEDDPKPEPGSDRRRTSRIRAAAVIAFALIAVPAAAQQTIFNVPSADVLDPGKVYTEVDELFRPTEPKFSSTTIRGVVGVVPHMEAGVNFGGFNSPGSIVPTANVAVKLQPLKIGDFAATAGGFGLFYLRGSQDGNPAGQGWGHLSYRIPTIGTRITVGGWYASAGYAKPNSTGGALAAFEQPLPWVKGLTLAADWWSGENSIGYLSPGFYWSIGKWTAYAAYTIKNGDSRGNGGLIELGYAF